MPDKFRAGQVFYDRSCIYANNKPKYIIILNTPTDEQPYFFALFTTTPQGNSNIYGCHQGRWGTYFSIDIFDCGRIFPATTYLKISDIGFNKVSKEKYESYLSGLNKYRFIMPDCLKDIINCIMQSSNVKQVIKDYIQDSVERDHIFDNRRI